MAKGKDDYQRRREHEEALLKLEAARLHIESEEITEENDLIRLAVAMEGERSFYKWFDDNEKVPHYGKRKERIKLLKERLNLHGDSVTKDD